MPKHFAKAFRAEGCTVYYRQRKRGKKSLSYEARYRRRGYNISVSAPTLEILEKRFVEAIRLADKRGVMPDVPTDFAGFAEYYIENFWRRRVSERTYKNETGRYYYHIKPYFGNMPLNRITPYACQKLLDGLISEGKCKTAAEVKSILNGIFNMAIKHRIIDFNPLDVVFYKKYTQVHGKALTRDEESKLLAETAGTDYQLMFAVALYTGMRPNEYATARIEGEFIVAKNSKQKDGKLHFKKIPITPMLKPYLEGVTELKFHVINRIGERFRAILPEHKLYDLRTTFYTRCQECGIVEVAIKAFVGHSLGGLADVYTDLSDEFLLKEGGKFKY